MAFRHQATRFCRFKVPINLQQALVQIGVQAPGLPTGQHSNRLLTLCCWHAFKSYSALHYCPAGMQSHRQPPMFWRYVSTATTPLGLMCVQQDIYCSVETGTWIQIVNCHCCLQTWGAVPRPHAEAYYDYQVCILYPHVHVLLIWVLEGCEVTP